MAQLQNTYEFANSKRSVNEEFRTMLEQNPTLSKVIGSWDGVVINTKHEWVNELIKPVSFSLTGAYTMADPTITVADTTGMKEGMILEYVKVDGTSATVKHYVTSVTNATTAAVTLHPGTVDENLAIGAVVYLNSTPIQQNSNIDTSVNFEGVMDYNYTQIFRRDFNVARTTQQVANYSIDDQIAKQEMYNLKQLEYQINRATISGERVAPTGTAIGTRGEMGGLFTFLRDGTGNKLDASGGALSPDLINDAAEIGLANGADGMAVMVCHPTQRRTISTFNDNIIRATREAAGTGIGQIAGGSVDIYETDQGLRLVIVADRAVAQDQLAIVDPSRIQYATMEGFTSEIYKVQGNDGINGTILGEITLEVRNPDDAHVLIEDLAV